MHLTTSTGGNSRKVGAIWIWLLVHMGLILSTRAESHLDPETRRELCSTDILNENSFCVIDSEASECKWLLEEQAYECNLGEDTVSKEKSCEITPATTVEQATVDIKASLDVFFANQALIAQGESQASKSEKPASAPTGGGGGLILKDWSALLPKNGTAAFFDESVSHLFNSVW